MKIKYLFMSMVLASVALTGFTSCSDDDDDAPVVPEKEELTFSADQLRVKIGADNRQLLPVATGNGEYNAYSLNPDVADVVVGDDGLAYVEGFKNGTASVVVSDAANQYKRIPVSVYTTDQMTLSHDSYEFNCPLGVSASTNECSVELGNGGYSIESDNVNVTPAIDEETGAITLTAKSRVNDYTAVITVKDCSGLSAKMTVTVKASFEGFTQSEIDEILAKTTTSIYGACKDPSDGTQPYYYYYYTSYGYGNWYDEADGDVYKLGWWYSNYKGGYGGLSIEYPATAAVNEEVDGTLYFQYSYYAWYDLYAYQGTVKVLESNSTRTVAIFWNVDMDNERINRGYFVHYK